MTGFATLLALVALQAAAPAAPQGGANDQDVPNAQPPAQQAPADAPRMPREEMKVPPLDVSGDQAPLLTLEQALQIAAEQNLDLRTAQSRLQQSQLLSRRVWANYLPALTVAGSYTRNNVEAKFGLPTRTYIRDLGPQAPPGLNGPPAGGEVPGEPTTLATVPAEFMEVTIQPINQWGAQAQLTQALIAPALWPAIKNAYLAEDVAALTVQNARREVLFGVAQAYYGAAALRQSVAVQVRLLENAQVHERDARVRFEAGAVPKIQLIRAQIDRARAEQDLVRSQNSLASAKLALATLMGRTDANFQVAEPQARELVDESADLQSLALKERLDVQVARKSLDLAERQRSAVYYRYAPNLIFNGTYRWANVGGFTGENTSWALTLALSWTLYDGGLREVDLKEAGYKILESQSQLNLSELRARQEVRQALLDLESARANRLKAEEQLKLARENMQLVDVNYASGVATQLEISDAQAALAAAERGLVAERLNADLSALRLAKAAGAFTGGPLVKGAQQQ